MMHPAMRGDTVRRRTDPERATVRRARWLGAVVAVAVLAVFAGGLWLIGAAAPTYASSVAYSSVWVVGVGAAAVLAGRRWRAVRVAAVGTFAVAALIAAAGFYWTSIHDDRVDEVVVTGVAPNVSASAPAGGKTPSARNVQVAVGAFRPRAHPGHGTASVVALADGGRKLTLTAFETDNGPDLRVYLVPGPVNGDSDVDDVVDLGRLKGNIGDQQYDIPAEVDIAAHDTVVVWCRAFSVSFTQATLTRSS